MESSLDRAFVKTEYDENDMENFVCNFCYMNFTTIFERDQHLETHLIRQNCPSCKIPMILIGNQLYELHLPTKCKEELTVEDSQPLVECEHKRKTRSVSKRSKKKIEPLSENRDSVNESEDTKSEKLHETVERTNDFQSMGDINDEAQDEFVQNTDDFTTENHSSASDSDFSPGAPATKNTKKHKTTTKTKKTLKAGITYKKYPKTIPCDMCDQKFGVQRTLITHQKKVHNKIPVFKCDTCGMILKTALYLKNHIAIHIGEKRYICNYCGKGFHLAFHLKEHIYQHTGEKPYKCEICGKTFGRQTLRAAHMRVHTGEKPFKCTEENCERAYSHLIDLKRHRRTAHGIILKTFECPICSKIFYENKFLTKHLNVHQENELDEK